MAPDNFRVLSKLKLFMSAILITRALFFSSNEKHDKPSNRILDNGAGVSLVPWLAASLNATGGVHTLNSDRVC